jgi:hypothetical protein
VLGQGSLEPLVEIVNPPVLLVVHFLVIKMAVTDKNVIYKGVCGRHQGLQGVRNRMGGG